MRKGRVQRIESASPAYFEEHRRSRALHWIAGLEKTPPCSGECHHPAPRSLLDLPQSQLHFQQWRRAPIQLVGQASPPYFVECQHYSARRVLQSEPVSLPQQHSVDYRSAHPPSELLFLPPRMLAAMTIVIVDSRSIHNSPAHFAPTISN